MFARLWGWKWPLTDLSRIWVRNASLFNPITRLKVIRVIDRHGRVDSRGKVLEQRTLLDRLLVDEDLVGVVRASNVNGDFVSCVFGGIEGI